MAELRWDTRDAAPESIRAALTERSIDGKPAFVFDGGNAAQPLGYVPRAEHEQFRNNNIELKRQAEELTATVAKYKDIDPDKARAALTQLQKLQDKKLIEDGEVDKLVAQRAEKPVAEKQARIDELEKSYGTEKERAEALAKELATLKIHAKLDEMALSPKVGVRQTSLALVKLLADHGDADGVRWILNDKSEAVAVKADGTPAYSKLNVNQALGMEEWLRDVCKAHPEICAQSSGGGAAGNTGGAGGNGNSNLANLSPSDRMRAGRRAA